MAIVKKIKEDLEALEIISTITSVYQEIAKMRMLQIREDVLKNRVFLEELAKIYHKVKMAYLFALEKRTTFKKREELERLTFLKKRKRVAVIFLSANQPFYGNLIHNIWGTLFMFLKEREVELIVVGKTGRDFVSFFYPSKTYSYFDLDDDKPKDEEIKKIAEFAKNYQTVLVFHGKFESITKQTVVISEISGSLPIKGESKKTREYLFEPSPKEIFQFFETEIFTSLLKHTIFEHQLAKFSARLVAMYEATERSKEIKKRLELEKRKLQKELFNKKQLDLFSGYQLWIEK